MKKKSENITITDDDIAARKAASQAAALKKMEEGEITRNLAADSKPLPGEMRPIIADGSKVRPLTPEQRAAALAPPPEQVAPVLPPVTPNPAHAAAKQEILNIFASCSDPNQMLTHIFLWANDGKGIDVWGTQFGVSLVTQQRLMNTLRFAGVGLTSAGAITRRPPQPTKPATMTDIRNKQNTIGD